MAQSTLLQLRGTWLQVHKWIGLLLGILIVPIALTGSALVWNDWLDETLNPQRYEVSGPPALTPEAYAAAARGSLAPGERVMSIRLPGREGGPVTVTAVGAAEPGARPGRTSLWLDPADGRLLDKAASNSGLVRMFHSLHGSLMVPGWGRTIVGWVGVAMFVSCLTGLWLWWPVTGSVRRGLRWKRRNTANANLHHQMGFWILLPLAMLSFTGFWISFPGVFGAFEANRPKAGSGAPDRARALQARPLEKTALTADAALAAAGPHSTGPLMTVSWPTDQSPKWKIAFERAGGPAEVEIADSSGEVTPPRPPRPETLARTMRRWHDGTGMGAAWQVVIFVGGIIPAALVVTGLIMWLRSRGWRADARRRRERARPAAAE